VNALRSREKWKEVLCCKNFYEGSVLISYYYGGWGRAFFATHQLQVDTSNLLNAGIATQTMALAMASGALSLICWSRICAVCAAPPTGVSRMLLE